MAGDVLPVKLPGKEIGGGIQVDAQKNWVDVLSRRDDGSSWHLWYRPADGTWPGGWQHEPLTAPQ